ncbi:13646_t:CDS:1, partial [Cetraspora pellucida]
MKLLILKEENENEIISIKSELLIIGNTMDLNLLNFIVQPLDSNNSKFAENKFKEDYGNMEFNIDAL